MRLIGIATTVIGLSLLSAVAVFILIGMYSTSQLHTIEATHRGKVGVPTKMEPNRAAIYQDSPAVNSGYSRSINKIRLNSQAPADIPERKTSQNILALSEDEGWVADIPSETNLFDFLRVDSLNNYQSNISPLIDGYSSVNIDLSAFPKYWATASWSSYIEHNSSELIPLTQSHLIDTASLTISDLLGKPHQIRIPVLKIKSSVHDLNIIDDGETKRYETPKQIVGRITTNLNLSDSVSGWYFGHLESPIKGEGNVFRNLPRIAEFLRDGDPVYIHVINQRREYIYQATESKIVHESKLKLYDAGVENIVLVTCANRPHYDFRQLVTAKLVGIK